MTTKDEPKRIPTHPGEILREDVLPALDMTTQTFADRVDIPLTEAEDLLNCKAHVDQHIAHKLGELCGNGPDLWLAMQKAYDEAVK